MSKKITFSIIVFLLGFLSSNAQNLMLHEFSTYKTSGDTLFGCTRVVNPLKTGNANDSVFRYYHNDQWGQAVLKTKNPIDGRFIAKASMKVFVKKPGQILIGLFKEPSDAGQITWNTYDMLPREVNTWKVVEFPINIAAPIQIMRLGINRNILPVTVLNSVGVARVDSTDGGGNVVFMDSIKLVKTTQLDSMVLYKENLDRMPWYAGDYKGVLADFNQTAVGQPARWNGGLAVTSIPADTFRLCNNWGNNIHSFQFLPNYPKAGTSIYVNNIDVTGFTKLRFLCDVWTLSAEIGHIAIDYKIDNDESWSNLTINTDPLQAWATKIGRLPATLTGSKLSIRITPTNISNEIRLDNFVVAGKAISTGIDEITYSTGKDKGNLSFFNNIVKSKEIAESISIYTVAGTLLKVVNNVSELNVSQLQKGIFIVKAKYADRSTSTIKIVL